MDNIRNKAYDFAGQNPKIMLIAVAILIVVILVLYLNSCGILTKNGFKSNKKSKRKSSDDELDDLINSIHEKQKKNR